MTTYFIIELFATIYFLFLILLHVINYLKYLEWIDYNEIKQTSNFQTHLETTRLSLITAFWQNCDHVATNRSLEKIFSQTAGTCSDVKLTTAAWPL